MSSKRAIPSVPQVDSPRQAFDQALKENLEVLMGQRVAKIKPLSSSAALSDVISKVNEIIERLQ